MQQARKEQSFDVADRIVLSLAGDDALLDAVRAHVDYLQREVLATTVEFTESAGATAATVDGKTLRVGLVKA